MNLLDKYKNEVELFIKVCHRVAAKDFVTAYGGNLAWKLEENLILITPTQMYKGDIEKQDVLFLNFDGNTVEGTRKPTGEKPMYLKFFKERPDITSVIHCHPPCACATAIMKGENHLMRPYYPETVTEVGPVPIVPYAQPLTQKLAENFAPFLQKYNSFMMENHGLVTMSRGDIYWTLLNIELLEGTVDSLLKALSVDKIKELDKKAVTDLGDVMKTRGLPLFGAPGVNDSLEGMYF